jgi:hypothetical protein
MGAALSQCYNLQDRFTIIDVIDTNTSSSSVSDNIDANATSFRGGTLDLTTLKYGAAYYPFLNTSIDYAYDDDDVTVTHSPDLDVATGATGEDYDGPLSEVKEPATGTDADLELYNQIKSEIQNQLKVTLPPSSAVAGVYARVDRNRGVWKAPANEAILNIIGPNVKITHEKQGELNVDATSGKSINAIRTFTGKGSLIWGARTLAGNDNEWRYVPVRRFYIFAEESLKKATEFVVFEPNDANTWLRVKTMTSNFLTEQWRNGALAGATPDQAFFVNVGLGETMTSQDILEGRLIVEIGMAVVRPAEFIILRFSHKLQEA